MLTATQLSKMRDVQQAALPSTCTIQEPVMAKDSIGQSVRTWSVRAAGVACRLAPRKEFVAIRGEKETVSGDWVLTLDYDQAVELGDQVLVGSRAFEVTGTNLEKSFGTATRVDLTEIA